MASKLARAAAEKPIPGGPDPWHKRAVVVQAGFDGARPYRVHFDWCDGYKGWVNRGLGCTVALYDRGAQSRPSKAQQQPGDPARVKAVQDLWGDSAPTGAWLAAFAQAGPAEESAGHVYVYARESDMRLREEGKLAHVLLHKVGLTRRSPQQRIAEQEEDNKESYSHVLSVQTKYPQFLESQVHQLLAQYRVRKMSGGKLGQGGTEWFLVEQSRIVADVLKVKALMTHAWGDLA